MGKIQSVRGQYKACPKCDFLIAAGAKECRHCNYRFKEI